MNDIAYALGPPSASGAMTAKSSWISSMTFATASSSGFSVRRSQRGYPDLADERQLAYGRRQACKRLELCGLLGQIGDSAPVETPGENERVPARADEAAGVAVSADRVDEDVAQERLRRQVWAGPDVRLNPHRRAVASSGNVVSIVAGEQVVPPADAAFGQFAGGGAGAAAGAELVGEEDRQLDLREGLDVEAAGASDRPCGRQPQLRVVGVDAGRQFEIDAEPSSDAPPPRGPSGRAAGSLRLCTCDQGFRSVSLGWDDVCKAVGIPFVVVHDSDRRSSGKLAPGDLVLNARIADAAGEGRVVVPDPDFEAVATLDAHSHKPEHAWKEFAERPPAEIPEQLVRVAELAASLARQH